MKNKMFIKSVAIFLILNILIEILYPSIAFALTSGPSQPEVQSFEPVSTSELVDVKSGDMVYNIPLLDVGGYPINISYHSGITMDQEASWVGLGWNINPGSIVRNMRGLPDDYKNDPIKKQLNVKNNETYGLRAGGNVEFLGGALGLGVGLGVTINNYRGTSLDFIINPSIGAGMSSRTKLNVGLGIQLSTNDGVSLEPSLSFQDNVDKKSNITKTIGISGKYNSMSGLQSVGLDAKETVERKEDIVNQQSNSNDKKDVKLVEPSSYTKNHLGGSFSFAGKSYVPKYDMPTNTFAFALTIKPGGEFFGGHPNLSLNGFYSINSLYERETNVDGVGYMYSSYGVLSDNSLLDFNREKDIPFRRDQTDLPITIPTYDLFSFSAEGTGGTFRPHKSNVAYYYDPFVRNFSESGDVGLDLGLGNALKVGVNGSLTFVESHSGLWSTNDLYKSLEKVSVSPNNDYENVYFKNTGERTVIADESYFDVLGGDKVVYAPLTFLRPKAKFKKKDGSETTVTNNNNHQNKRGKRTQLIQALDGKKARVAGLSKMVESYPQGSYYSNEIDPNALGLEMYNSEFNYEYPVSMDKVSRISGYRQGHHISEVSVINDDGKRYYYGLPAYNAYQSEKVFSVSSNRPLDDNDNLALNDLVKYSNNDNSLHNNQGKDNYYSSTNLPPYAHSFMLTGVVSPDYVDITGNGITDDDLGTFTKINYTCVYGFNNQDTHIPPYKWRTPYTKNSHYAQFEEGSKALLSDNKASYVYGEKEIWYVHSIESKNYIAEFEISNDRADTKEALGENGGKGSRSLYKLVAIKLYHKSERIKEGVNAKPIRTVHFEYDYSLCKYLPNNENTELMDFDNSGKLTLKKIYFTTQNSNNEALYPYRFVYQSSDKNPSYSSKDIDRWGNYKLNTTNNRTKDDPYTPQNGDSVNKYVQAWSLTQIQLPSGGKITFEYESDDYAYVQNKKAMNMFQIAGISSSASSSGINTSSTLSIENNSPDNNYFFFNIPKSIKTSDVAIRNQLFRDRFLTDENGNMPSDFYFKFMMGVAKKNKSAGDILYDYVIGYGEIDVYGIDASDHSNGYYTRAYIKFKKVKIGDRENGNTNCHPISKASWQFARLNLSEIISNENPNGGIVDAIKNIITIANSIQFMFKGFNKTLKDWGWGSQFQRNYSFIRFYNPNKIKYGGGLRVKTVKLNDRWGDMDGGTPNFDYGYKYTYLKKEIQPNGEELLISSGVASYEPLIGNDENPFRIPVYINKENLLAPDDNHYIEKPYGEGFFPSPRVTYSYIKVESLVKNSGYEEYEFYTSRDFPTIVDKTNSEHQTLQPATKIMEFTRVNVKDFVAASQGYLIENNDMDGKPKSHWVYAVDGTPISGVQYEYSVMSQDKSRLNNMVKVINENGVVSDKEIGKEIEMSVDFRHSESHTWNQGFMSNVDGFITFIFPAIIPRWFALAADEHLKFSSVVATKHVFKYGLIKQVTYYNENAKTIQRNELYDSETGSVVMTSTTNEFRDNVYDFNYPAYWAYDGMGPAYKNINLYRTLIVNNGSASVTDANKYYSEGDEIVLSKPGNDKLAWISYVGTNSIYLIDRSGAKISNDTYMATVVRSGRRNMQAVSAGSIQSLTKPSNYNTFTNVLNAQVDTYSDKWGLLMKDDSIYNKNKRTCHICELTVYSADLLNLINALINNKKLIQVSTAGTGYFGPGKVALNLYPNYVSSDLKLIIENGYTLASGSYPGHYYYLSVDPDSIQSTSLNATISYPYDIGSDVITCGVTISRNDTSLKFRNLIGIKDPSILSADTSSFNAIGIFSYQDSLIVEEPVAIYTTCAPMRSCYTLNTENPNFCINTGSPTQTINPYVTGMRGNWRKQKTYNYRDTRKQNTTSGVTELRKDGVYNSFTPFWTIQSNAKMNPNVTSKWIQSNVITEYDPFGNELENLDPLDRFSAALFGFNDSRAVAVASNARYRQIGYDGFEDYEMETNVSCATCNAIDHFNFKSQIVNETEIVNEVSHSGFSSIKLGAQSIIQEDFSINNSSTTKYNYTSSASEITSNNVQFIGLFEPDTGKYIFSYWYKGNDTLSHNNTFLIDIKNSSNSSISYTKQVIKGSKVEGWRKVDVIFHIPSTASKVIFKLKNISNQNLYFDDVRIHPFSSSMKTYAYDKHTMRLMAELDENNYATFYEYDNNGKLIRIKKETERGIMTIKEYRSNKSELSGYEN